MIALRRNFSLPFWNIISYADAIYITSSHNMRINKVLSCDQTFNFDIDVGHLFSHYFIEFSR